MGELNKKYEGFEDVTEDCELDWDSEIENDSPGFVLLPEGDYNFVVGRYERGRHNGSEKLPPCDKAILYIEIDGGQVGSVTIKHNLFLHKRTEGMLCAFFAAIGQRKHGEKVRMKWITVPGSTGRLKLGIREWKTESGEVRQSNQIKKFYDPEESPEPKVEQTSFKPGEF